jgi:hypothetical protein
VFILPLIIVLAGFAIYKVLRRQPHPATGTMSAQQSHAVAQTSSFWPTTTLGMLGIGSFVLYLVSVALVNAVQLPFLGWILLVAALTLTGIARIGKHDRSASVLIVLIVTGIGAVASLLFLAGEIFIGHA